MPHFVVGAREVFADWLDEGQPQVTMIDGQPYPARDMLQDMTDCTDTLPGDYCDELDLPRGSSYGDAAQRLLRERR